MRNKMTRDDAVYLDNLAAQPAPKYGMPLEQRKKKNKNWQYRVVQTGAGGGHAVRTESHPDYDSHRAKAKAETISWAASSTTVWSRDMYWSTWEMEQAYYS